MFIPKHLKEWKPPRAEKRRCFWCCAGPKPMHALVQVMEGPMRWYFCDPECAVAWQHRRHKRGWHKYLKKTAAQRAQIPMAERYATLTACGCELDDLCGLHNLEVPLPQDTELPPQPVLSEHHVSGSDHAVVQ